MPIVTLHEENSVPFMLTPAAIPSGNLCMAMARMNSITLFSEALFICSSLSNPVNVCMCGVKKSMMFRNIAPSITPPTITHHGILSDACSKAGTINPIVDAASMIPAQ